MVEEFGSPLDGSPACSRRQTNRAVVVRGRGCGLTASPDAHGRSPLSHGGGTGGRRETSGQIQTACYDSGIIRSRLRTTPAASSGSPDSSQERKPRPARRRDEPGRDGSDRRSLMPVGRRWCPPRSLSASDVPRGGHIGTLGVPYSDRLPVVNASGSASTDSSLELCLGHPRPAVDVLALRLGVQLVLGAATGAGV